MLTESDRAGLDVCGLGVSCTSAPVVGAAERGVLTQPGSRRAAHFTEVAHHDLSWRQVGQVEGVGRWSPRSGVGRFDGGSGR